MPVSALQTRFAPSGHSGRRTKVQSGIASLKLIKRLSAERKTTARGGLSEMRSGVFDRPAAIAAFCRVFRKPSRPNALGSVENGSARKVVRKRVGLDFLDRAPSITAGNPYNAADCPGRQVHDAKKNGND